MKKVFSALILIGFLAVMLAPMFASAQEAPQECCILKRAVTLGPDSCAAGEIAAPSAQAAQSCGSAAYCNASASKWGMFCVMNTLYSITDWIFVVLVALAGIFVIIGAATLLMAAGTPEKITSGRNYVMYAAIGLLVGLLSRAIPNLVKIIGGM